MSSRIHVFTNLRLHVARTFILCMMFALLLLNVFYYKIAAGADLTQRSARVGSALSSANTTHDFRFTVASAVNVGSIKLDYCSNGPFYGDICTSPVGLNVSGGIITSQIGQAGFAISLPDSDSNTLVLTRPSAPINTVSTRFVFSNVINQSSSNQTVFVRISLHGSTDGSGVPSDKGTVAFSTTSGVAVGGYVPPYLTFCVGVIVSENCSTAAGSFLDFGEFSSTSTKTATSQFAVFTNDLSGYVVYMNGATMTSGNYIIPALTASGPSTMGTGQFGVNLRSNSIPSVGSNVSGEGSGFPLAGYDTANTYRLVDGEAVAQSSLPTAPNIFTVSYIVNVADGQHPGIYSTTFIYTGMATF